MLIGTRYHGSSKYTEEIVAAAGKYMDVISINYYGRIEPEENYMDMWLDVGNKPFIITEFYTMGDDTGLANDNGAGLALVSQADRAKWYENFVLKLLSNKANVGYHWFRYIDNNNTNKGVYSANYTKYEELAASFTKINKDIYSLRSHVLYGSANFNAIKNNTISISLTSGTNPSCVNQSLTYTATISKAAKQPSYQWKVNGINSGTSNAVFSSSALVSGDAISCVLTSSGACASSTTASAFSNTITPVIYTNKTPTVAIAITAGNNPSTAGTELEFTATATNSGSAPSYQWAVNGANAGTNNVLFSSSTLVNADVVSCTMISNGLCLTVPTSASNTITLTRIENLTQIIALKQGWNLISTNVHPQDSSIATLFATLDVQEIKTANSFWLKGQASSLNGIDALTSGQAYLVKMNAVGDLAITGTKTQEVVTVASLSNGWNLVGCPYQTTTNLSEHFDDATIEIIKNFEGFWTPTGSLNSIQALEVGKAYFVKK